MCYYRIFQISLDVFTHLQTTWSTFVSMYNIEAMRPMIISLFLCPRIGFISTTKNNAHQHSYRGLYMSCFVRLLGKARAPLSRLPRQLAPHLYILTTGAGLFFLDWDMFAEECKKRSRKRYLHLHLLLCKGTNLKDAVMQGENR